MKIKEIESGEVLELPLFRALLLIEQGKAVVCLSEDNELPSAQPAEPTDTAKEEKPKRKGKQEKEKVEA